MIKTNKLKVYYDEVTDMLYIEIDEFQPSIYEDGEWSPLMVKKSRSSNKIIGLLVENFSNVYKRGIYKYSKLPKPFSYEKIMKIIEDTAKEYNI